MGVVLALLTPRRSEAGLAADLRDGLLCFCGRAPREGDEACGGAMATTLLSAGGPEAHAIDGNRTTEVLLYSAQTFLCLR